MGPSTDVSPTPPRRRRERTSSTRFRVATSMRWKLIVPTRTCRVCSLQLLRFDEKKWCFCSLSNSSSPLPFPDRSFFNTFKRSASIQWLGGRMQRATLGVVCTSGEITIAMQVYVYHCSVQWRSSSQLLQLHAAQLAVHTKTESSRFVGSLIRQRHSQCQILSQNVLLSTNDGAFARRVSSAACTTWVRSLQPPNQSSSPAPTPLTVGSKKNRRPQR